jgi:hypothetical protein
MCTKAKIILDLVLSLNKGNSGYIDEKGTLCYRAV